MTDERCERCDQPKGDQARADALPITRRWLVSEPGARRPRWSEVVAAWAADQPGRCLDGTCAPIDWRARCLAAEAVLATLHIDEAGIRKMITAEAWRAKVEPLIENLRDANEAWSEAGDDEREAAQDAVCDAIDAVVAAAQKETADA